ncbi:MULTISPECIES: AI-2E family transporter [Halomonas]|uniref:Uncharacterized protein DUF20 n=1 Tax=Halomonas ventosae TaxID=229007 RepID=A0A4R6HNB0_9GAMM|nr:AI-2E family transporter [Halomonas ventosae]TDO09781.1 uncharacterized protein DUF20 [Halomonas ventosae]
MPDHRQTPLAGGARVSSQYSPTTSPDKRLFNVAELRLFRYTAVLLSLAVLTFLVGIMVWAFGWILNSFYNLLMPLAIAVVLALVLHPVVELLERRLHLPNLLVILLILVVFFVGIAGLVYLLVPLLVSQTVQLMTLLPDTLANWEEHFSTHFPGLSSMISISMESSGGAEAQPALAVTDNPGTAIMSNLGLLAGISFVPLFLFFTLLS